MSNANAAQKRRIDALLRLPENKVCFECLENQPRWASTNLGVFLCLRCAGLHRSAGTHVSKVRSATMDTWEEEMIRCCENIGNARGRVLYEYNMPDSVRPNASTNGALAERLIREKYEQRRYFNVEYDSLLKKFMSEGASQGSSTPKDEKRDVVASVPAPPSLWVGNSQQTAQPTLTAGQTKQSASANGISIDDLFSTPNAKTNPNVGTPVSPQPVGVVPQGQFQQTSGMFHPAGMTPFGMEVRGPSQGNFQAPAVDAKQEIMSLFTPSNQGPPHVYSAWAPSGSSKCFSPQ
ncbi:ADP-ribosylation factor GTPase activating protein, putative [Trypanosoma equiperdum]|uniref:ADP-ribosylation factor GTPase activating protein, putative n=2 Tax=Trypanozoon TaxID=39700 RepID=Q384B0_TRYB2|nr:ADP-ribosylation factor GTPase activating protein, putative [Trypanosoma brucei brucei TREU927]EAN79871.1 ADP-ribosylation factor GTPase activating protein, putative [Trypanosoma brucei brucei TREU927]SCU65614.1 ADP-ribosylation factor GTPase activating protein, putative [Trypanosoma equiperdum]